MREQEQEPVLEELNGIKKNVKKKKLLKQDFSHKCIFPARNSAVIFICLGMAIC